MSFYGFAQKVCILFFKLYFKINVKGLENIPLGEGKFILISNHQSNLGVYPQLYYGKNHFLL